MPDLRVALSLPYPRISYVKGNITGHEITSDPANGSTYAVANCLPIIAVRTIQFDQICDELEFELHRWCENGGRQEWDG